jgi:repressor LexA
MQKNTRPKDPLTESQEAVLTFIKNTCATRGAPPSYREIQEHFGFKAVGSVQGYVKALIRKGYLDDPKQEKGKRRARGLFPAGHRTENTKRIPIYGEIAAGPLRDTPQIELGSLLVSEETVSDPCFALRVVGDSMIEVGILEGDHLIVEKGARVRSGDIVVALMGGETTVKRYKETAHGIFLVPENKKLKPIKVTEKSFQIQGKVVGLQRKL